MKSFLSGILGGCLTIILCICISLCVHKQSQIFNPIHVVTTNYEVDDTTISNLKSFEVNEKLKEIEMLKAKGVLLTPQEYTAHIESFYNNIIVILVALLGVFSLATYFHLRFLAKDEIQKQVKEVLTSSSEIKQIIENNIEGKIEDAVYNAIDEEIVTKSDLKSEIKKVIEQYNKYDVEDESEIDESESEKLKSEKVKKTK